MRYLFRAREFSMNHITNDLREKWMRQDQGIFSEDYKLDSER